MRSSDFNGLNLMVSLSNQGDIAFQQPARSSLSGGGSPRPHGQARTFFIY
jgi:hypothetical protein